MLEEMPGLLNVSEASVILRVAQSTVRTAIRRKQLPSITLGRRVLIPKLALERLLEGGSDGGEHQAA